MLDKKFKYIFFLSQFFILSAQAGWIGNKIEVRECYDPKEYRNYKEYIDHQIDKRIQGAPITLTRWDWDLDLKKKKALRITEINNEVNMEEFNLLVSDNLITVKQDSKNTTTFDKKRETVQVVSKEFSGANNKFQCIFK